MSNYHAKGAKMRGFEGPFFPKPLDSIQDKYRLNDRRLHVMFFEDVADQLNSGKLRMHTVTSDEYDWPFCLEYKHHGLTFRVTFPKTYDTIERRDGTTSDRHIALYVRGETDADRRAHAAEVLARMVDTEYDFRYHRR